MTTGTTPTGVTNRAHGAPDQARVDQLAERVVRSPRPEMCTLTSPLDGGSLGDVPLSSVGDVAVAFEGARSAQRSWARWPMHRRSQMLLRFHNLVLERQSWLMDLVQLESGKARRHAFEEVMDVAVNARHYARRSWSYMRSRRRPGAVPGLTQAWELRHPVGVVGIVSPWNYPLSLAITDAIPALMAGNTVVLRPDTRGALCALAVIELLEEAGLPERVLQVVLGDGPNVGGAVLEAGDVAAFTGSTQTGRQVAKTAGENLTPVTLELGGKNALYVADDAPLDRAVDGALRACFSSAGQLCISMERLILHEDVADEFLARFLPAVRGMRLGTELAFGPDMGSLAAPAQLERVQQHVADAVSKGATIEVGGEHRPDIGPYVYEPTVLSGVTEDMECYAHETFGPVVAVYRVPGDADAVRLANSTEYGLNASVWTANTRRGRDIAAALEYGGVNINEGYAATWGSISAPVGGVKASGLGPGRHGADGILRFTRQQTVASQRIMGLGPQGGMSDATFAEVMTRALQIMRHTSLS